MGKLPWLSITELSELKKKSEKRDQLFEDANKFTQSTEKTEEYLLLPFVFLDVGAVNLSIKAVSPKVLHAIFDHDDEQDNGQW